MSTKSISRAATPWEKYIMALDRVTERLQRITAALEGAGVPYALVGGQAVALWVATRDPAAVRTTKDVDILLRRADLPAARAAARMAGMDYFEVVSVGMFLENDDPNPRQAVHLIWAGEKVRPENALPAPAIDAAPSDRTGNSGSNIARPGPHETAGSPRSGPAAPPRPYRRGSGRPRFSEGPAARTRRAARRSAHRIRTLRIPP